MSRGRACAARSAGAPSGSGETDRDPHRLREIQAETLFELDAAGRLLRVNSPDRSPAPRLWRAGEVVRLRFDVADAAAVPVDRVTHELTYLFPEAPLPAPGAVPGTDLLPRLEAEGIPDELMKLRYRRIEDLWPPWCAVLDGDEIVSVACTARLSPLGAEVGLVTIPSARGRGFGAAAAAAWAAQPELAGRVRFYSTDAANRPSQRVAERLGLELLGDSMSVY